jgi:hypothetical protein
MRHVYEGHDYLCRESSEACHVLDDAKG